MHNAIRKMGGWTAIELLLSSAVAAVLIAGAYVAFLRQDRASRVDEMLGIVAAMRMQAEASSIAVNDQSNSYAAGAITSLQAMPSYWVETSPTNTLVLRNPIGEGTFQGLSTSTTPDGGSQYTFSWSNIPSWACADLSIGLSPMGFVYISGGRAINVDSAGHVQTPDPEQVARRCRFSTVSSITVTGPTI